MHTPVNTPTGPAKVGQLSAQAVTGCAIKKGQEDPPIKPDSEYPPWLFELMKPEASLMELERVYATEGLALGDVSVGVWVWGVAEWCGV
jgi:hypothetical protein